MKSSICCNCKPMQMRATFTGMNGSMGLVRGKKYKVSLYCKGSYVWVEWKTITGKNRCPYSSIKKVLENWTTTHCNLSVKMFVKNTVNSMLWRKTVCPYCDGFYASSSRSCTGCNHASEYRPASTEYLNNPYYS